MKRLLIIPLFFAPFIVSAFAVPAKPTGFVQDYAKMLTTEQITSLENKLEAYEKQSTNEIAVVTINSLDGDAIENVAQDIFTKWGIGKKDKNNGVLLLISLSDRQTRIQTGYGVEGELTDIGTSYIQSEIITPAFKEGKYYDGINGAVDEMIKALGGTEIVPNDYYNSQQNSNPKNWGFIFFLVIVAIQWIVAILARSKSWWAGGVLGGVIAIVLIFFFSLVIIFAIPLFIILVLLGLLLDYSVSKAYQNHKDGGPRPPWFLGGGGFGGGSSGGGFGGFGGGMSGGGGSSGRW